MKLKMYLVNKRMVILLILFSLFGIASIFAGTITPTLTSIAPSSLDLTDVSSGDRVGIIQLKMNEGTSDSGVTLDAIDVSLGTGSAWSDISDVSILYEFGGGALFGNDEAVIDVGTNVFVSSPDTIIINLDGQVIDGNSHWLYVAFIFSGTSTEASTFSCTIDHLKYTDIDTSTPYDLTLPSTVTTMNVDDYSISTTTTDLISAGAHATQGDIDVPFLVTEFDFSGDTGSTAQTALSSIVYTELDNSSDPLDFASYTIFIDSNKNGILDGVEVDITSGTTITYSGTDLTISGIDVNHIADTTFNPSVGPLPVTLIATLSATATPGHLLGFEFSSATFSDILTASPDDVYLNQKGNINNTVLGATNTYTVDELSTPDITPPTVAITVPADGSTDISRSSTISVAFNEAGTVQGVDISSFLVSAVAAGGSDISGTVSSPSQNVFVFTPDAEFDFNTTYYVRLAANVIGHVIEDGDNNALAANYDFSFLTGAQYPNTTKPIAVNNSILPGSSSPVVIIVPEPAGGPTTKVTVAVFTPTGKRIATLVDNRPYQDVLASPLEWFGTNGANKKLGPGIYFIVVSSKDSSETLKVRIVR